MFRWCHSYAVHFDVCYVKSIVELQIPPIFPCASAGGPDGLRPQHVKDMVGAVAGEGGLVLAKALTGFINMVLEARLHPLLAHSSSVPPW